MSDAILVAILFSIVYFALLGVRPLFVPDEGRYAEIAREMVANNDFITPYLNGIKYFEKPALFYWLGAAAIKVGGLNLWSLRSVNAILGVIGIVMTYIVSRMLYTRGTGIIAAFALGSSILYFIMSHMVSLDLPVTVFLTASLYALLLGLQASDEIKQRNAIWFAAVMAALAVLTKGLIGIVFPGAIFLAYLIMTREWALLKKLPIFSSLILFFAITAPWHILVGMRHPDFYYFYFVDQHILRYTTPDVGHYQPVWFFIPCLLLGFFPWVAYLPQTVIYNCKEASKKTKEGRIALFLLLWAGIIFVFFSFSKSKLIPYILPVIPPLAVLTARYLASKAKTSAKSLSFTISNFAIFLMALVIGYTLITFPQTTALPNNVFAKQMLAFAAGILVTGLGCSFVITRYSLRGALKVTNATMLGFLLAVIASIPAIDARSIHPLANIIKPKLTPETEVITYNQYYQDLPFYLERTVSILNWQNELTHGMLHQDNHDWMIDDAMFWKLWNDKNRVFVIIDNDELEVMKKSYPNARPYRLGKTVNNSLISNQPLE